MLSAYGPIPDAPRQLFGGPGREISFEEMRLFHYGLHASGNQQQAIQQAQSLAQQAQQQNQVALNDIDRAIRYIVDGEKEHPNRVDICEAVIRASSTNIPSVPLQTVRPSNPVAPSTTLGTNFQTAPGTNTQPFAPSSTSGTGFRANTGTSTQPFAPSFTSGFGSQTTTGTNAQPFVPPSIPSVGFQNTAGTNTQQFAATSTPGSGFQAATSTNAQPFASSSIPGVGLQNTVGTNTQPFASSSTSGNGFHNTTGINTRTFPPVTRLSFSESVAEPANPFTGFAPRQGKDPVKPKPASPFAPVISPLSSSNPLHSAGISNASLSSGPTLSTGLVQQPSAIKAVKDSGGRLVRWDGKPVTYVDKEPCYRGTDGSWVRIWFPDGPPEYRGGEELPLEAYDETTKENYAYLREHGTFKDGVMPTLAPRREWCRWEF